MKKPKTQSQLIETLAEATDLPKKQVKAFLDAFTDVLKQELKQAGQCLVPGVARVKTVKKAATKAREGRNPATGEAITIAAKPARTVVKAYVVKALKDEFVA